VSDHATRKEASNKGGGWGTAIAPDGVARFSNFGGNTMSELAPDGTPLSPGSGWPDGGLDHPRVSRSTCSAVLAQLVPRYLDAEAFAVAEGAVPETTALLEQKWDLIFFTGSPQVGKIVH
jgi:hypothetical protein